MTRRPTINHPPLCFVATLLLATAISACGADASIGGDGIASRAETADNLVGLPASDNIERSIPGIEVLEPPATTMQPSTAATVAQTTVELTTTTAPKPSCEGFRVADVLFRSGSARLNDTATTSFERLRDQMPDEGQIEIVGHTDNIPTPEGNQALSEARAASVKDALVSVGVSPARITNVVGLAESTPIASNESVDGRAMNRRVEIWVNCGER